MKSSNELFQLIKSLEKSEKRYFRLYCSFHDGNKKYMMVFDAIDKQKEYDEKRIIALFRKEKFAKHFPVVKQYLYTLVLDSLKSYHSTVESIINGHLHGISILYKKRLYAQCEKLITKAKKIAVRFDLQSPLIELMQWEVKLIGKQSFIGVNEHRIRHIFNNIFNSIEQYKTTNNYLLSIYLLYLHEMKTGNIRNSSDMKELKRIIEEIVPPNLPKTAPPNLPKGEAFSPQIPIRQGLAGGYSPPLGELEGAHFQSLYLFYTAYSIYFARKNDYKNACIYDQKLIELLDRNPHQIDENPMQYAYAIYNLYVNFLLLKKYKESASAIQKLKKVQVKSAMERMDIDFMTDSMNLSLSLGTGSFNKGLQLIQSIEGKWDKIDASTIGKWRMLRFQYNTAYLYFVTKNYNKSNEHLNKILNEPLDIRNDLQCFSQILSLLIYFEMGNQDLLEYKVKSVHRFLYKRNRLYKIETIILDYIRKEVPKIHSEKELLKSFEVLLIKIRSLIKDRFEQKALNFFDFITWLESKTQKKSYEEVLRNKIHECLH